MQIKPHHKIRNKKSIWNRRTWMEAIDMSVGIKASKMGWQCGLNVANDDTYYIWYWQDGTLCKDPVPNDLNKYIEELCKKRKYIA